MKTTRVTVAHNLSILIVTILGLAPTILASTGTLILTSDTTLHEDHQGNILINASKVILDCAGHTVSGPGIPGFSGGIEVAGGMSDVAVRRCNVTGFEVNGIFSGGTQVRVEANNVYSNSNHGISVGPGNGFIVLGNTCHSNGAIGIVLDGANDSWVVQNTLEANRNWAALRRAQPSSPPT